MLTKIVNAIQAFAVVAAAVTVLFLFDGGESDGGADTAVGGTGADVYAANCAGCHGSDGGGSVGPALAGGAVVDTYPDIADQIAVIAAGQGGMPSFGDRLSAEEIEAVATYTRDEL